MFSIISGQVQKIMQLSEVGDDAPCLEPPNTEGTHLNPTVEVNAQHISGIPQVITGLAIEGINNH